MLNLPFTVPTNDCEHNERRRDILPAKQALVEVAAVMATGPVGETLEA